MMTDFDRRLFLFIGAAVSVAPGQVFAAPKAPTVLFICEYGTAKSAIARELFRRRATARGISVTAFSRGLKLEDHISPPLRVQLDAEKIDSRRDGFAIVARKDVRRADIVVGFTPIPAALGPRHVQDWSAVPSINEHWREARADLEKRIDALLDSIEVQGRRGR